MRGNKDPSNKFEALRQQAEKLIQKQPHSSTEPPPDILDLIHELKIHQAELEIQNEELQRAQQELSELHREFENLYEFAPCGYLTINNSGLITHLNLTGSRLLDTDRKRISRLSFSHFIDSDFDGAYFSARKRSGETGRKQSIELPIKRTNSPPLWVRADIEADKDETGAVNQWRVVLMDVTEKKNALDNLARSETKYKNIMESITDAMIVCSPDRTISYMNPAMLTRLGYDAVGETCYSAMHGLSNPCDWCPFEKVRNGQTVEHNIQSPLDKRNYRLTHMPVLNEDQTVSKLAIYKDITDYLNAVKEKEKAQASLQQAQKMESIGTLAGGIAHEFNNMLGIIIGNTELALDDIPEWNPAADCIQEIRTASLRAKDIVQKLLSVARKTPTSREPIQISPIINESLDFMRKTIPATIDIRQNISCSTEMILGDATEINQVVINLCSNSVHAMTEQTGVLEVDAETVQMDHKSSNNYEDLKPGYYVRLTVRDSGCGIKPELIQRVFDPYFTTKDVDEGLGMGLAVVHGIVKKHDGAIKIESEVGKGTTVEVLFPLIEKKSEQHHRDINTPERDGTDLGD